MDYVWFVWGVYVYRLDDVRVVCILLQVGEHSDRPPSLVFHWGSPGGDSSTPLSPHVSDMLATLGVRQIVSSQKHRLVLTCDGKVFSLSALSSGDFLPEVRMHAC